VVGGHFQHHAIPGNGARLKAFRHDVLRQGPPACPYFRIFRIFSAFW
jgi:hypothetical protein